MLRQLPVAERMLRAWLWGFLHALYGRLKKSMYVVGFRDELYPNTMRHAMTKDALLSLDLSHYSNVFCWYHHRTCVAEFRTIQATPERVRTVLARKRVLGLGVVFGAYLHGDAVHGPCEAKGLSARVASTTGPAWKWNHVKRMNDRDDASKLARLEAAGEIERVANS